jgi:hypothetical protein
MLRFVERTGFAILFGALFAIFAMLAWWLLSRFGILGPTPLTYWMLGGALFGVLFGYLGRY